MNITERKKVHRVNLDSSKVVVGRKEEILLKETTNPEVLSMSGDTKSTLD